MRIWGGGCQLCLSADVDRVLMTTTWQARARFVQRWQMAGSGARAKEGLGGTRLLGVAQINGGLGVLVKWTNSNGT